MRWRFLTKFLDMFPCFELPGWVVKTRSGGACPVLIAGSSPFAIGPERSFRLIIVDSS